MLVYICQSQSPNSSHHYPLSPLGVRTFVLYICVSISALQTGSSVLFIDNQVFFKFFFFLIYLFICLFIYLFIYFAEPGLSCGTQDLRCRMRDLHYSVQDLSLQHAGALVAACGLLVATCGI